MIGGVASSIAAQGVAIATGLQSKFDWTAIAASGVGAALSYGTGTAVGKVLGKDPVSSIISGTLGGTLSGVAQASMVGTGKVNWGLVAADAFDSALGDSLKEAVIANDQQQTNQEAYTTRYSQEDEWRAIFDYQPGNVGTTAPATVEAAKYGGAAERVARAQLGVNASPQEINRYVAQLIELNDISPRRVSKDAVWSLPDSNTPDPTWGYEVRANDNMVGEQIAAQKAAQNRYNAIAAKAESLFTPEGVLAMGKNILQQGINLKFEIDTLPIKGAIKLNQLVEKLIESSPVHYSTPNYGDVGPSFLSLTTFAAATNISLDDAVARGAGFRNITGPAIIGATTGPLAIGAGGYAIEGALAQSYAVGQAFVGGAANLAKDFIATRSLTYALANNPVATSVVTGMTEAAVYTLTNTPSPYSEVGTITNEFSAGRSIAASAGSIATKEGMSGAESAKQAADLSKHLTYTQKYGSAGVKALENGQIRYYGELQHANKTGEMAGRRYVHEFDPATNSSRGWHETIDHSGNVRQVRPVLNNGVKIHYRFDHNGNYIGSW